MSVRNVKNIDDQLRQDEGEVLHEYKDHLGFSTIGIGVLIDRRKGGGITPEESLYLFHNRLNRVESEIRRRWPAFGSLDVVRQGALLNMGYQLGVAGLMNFKKMLAALEVKNYDRAALEMADSKWAKSDTPERAKRLIKQMITGEWQ